MTQAEIRRGYQRLIGMVERQAHSKFKKKPALVFCPGGRPRSEGLREQRGKQVVSIKRAVIKIPRSVARKDPDLAKLAVMHELREALAFQNGQSSTRAHRIARRSEKTFRRKLGIEKTGSYMHRKHYGR